MKFHFTRFLRDEDGAMMTIEFLFASIFMFWFYVETIGYWQAYATANSVQKAAYSVSDLISRQTAPVNDAFINGMRDVMDYQTSKTERSRLRITSYRWDEEDAEYQVIWSASPQVNWSAASSQNTFPPLTDATLNLVRDRLPRMADGDTAILLEARVSYTPTVRSSLGYLMDVRTTAVKDHLVMEHFVVTRPRFLPCILHESIGPAACS